MNQSIVTKIKDGKLTLPKQLQQKFNNAEVIFVPAAEGSFFMKPIETEVSWQVLKPKLKKLGKMISNKDINDAIAWARKKVYKSRS